MALWDFVGLFLRVGGLKEFLDAECEVGKRTEDLVGRFVLVGLSTVFSLGCGYEDWDAKAELVRLEVLGRVIAWVYENVQVAVRF